MYYDRTGLTLPLWRTFDDFPPVPRRHGGAAGAPRGGDSTQV